MIKREFLINTLLWLGIASGMGATIAACSTPLDGRGLFANRQACGGTFTVHEPGKAPKVHENRC